ncbi:MAG TPA: tetratricopeptide repeat protein [Candidatus Polarisedimenticolaceae bacterium]|nr:tetratricopeptide repeat protein [Candidatus Polarisedimenticolaceae bacterium]
MAKRVTAILLLLSAAGLARGGYPLPRSSEEGAARQESWRLALERADRAVSERRWDEAERLFAAVVDESEAADVSGMMRARALDGLADLHQRASRHEQAARLYGEAATMWERLLGPSQPRLGLTLRNLGVCYVALGRADEARLAFERALAIFERAFGPSSAEVARTRRMLDQLADS